MQIILFEDSPSALLPFTFLKSSWDVALGGITLKQWIEGQFLGNDLLLHRGSFRDAKIESYPVLIVNGCALPSQEFAQLLQKVVHDNVDTEIKHGDDVVCALYTTDRSQAGSMAFPYSWRQPPLLHGPWDIIGTLSSTLAYTASLRARSLYEARPGVFIGKGVELPSTLITKTATGSIIFDEGCEIGEYSVIRGPVIFGKRCKINDAAIIEGSSFGDVCKIGGEIEKCVFDAYSNKQHHGYFGHTIVGSWVNIGAGATTSDLKHTYGSIRVDRGFGREETGLQFCGSFIGEGSRIAINASVMAGAILGINVFAFGNIHGYIPSFSSSTRHGLTEIPFEVAWHSRERAMMRRNIEPTPHERDAYAAMYEKTGVEREKRNVHRGMPMI